MGRLLDIVTPLHKATKRDYLARMVDDKVHCMMKAKEYEFDYWDGDRRYGYGGYKFIEGRWKPVAQALIDIYGLKNGSKVLDVGCGKAFLLYEMKKILPDAADRRLRHFEARPRRGARRGQAASVPLSRAGSLSVRRQELRSCDLARLLSQSAPVRVADGAGRGPACRQKRLRDARGLSERTRAVQSRMLGADRRALLHTSEWIWLYQHFGYTGDYEFIYFE